jgi:tetraacyldisaccharide 4'-kinase
MRRPEPIVAAPLGAAAEALFSLGVRVRGVLYDGGVLPSVRLPATVVSVGNITVGGTGKTPVVIELARRLRDRGRRVALLSRGYGRSGARRLVHLPPGREPLDGDHLRYGDEPCLLRRRLPDLPIVLAPDRVAAGREAIRSYGADLLLLDDGMQHRKLARDREVVVVSADAPFGNGHLLPRGPLREPPPALARADTLFINQNRGEPEGTEERLDRAGAPSRRVRFRYVADALFTPDGSRLAPSRLEGRRVALLSGIGNPGSFETTVRNLGAEVVRSFTYGDHHRFRPREMAELSGVTERDDLIPVTTEKDRCRIGADEVRSLRIHTLRIGLAFESGEEHLIRMIDELSEGNDR